VGVKLLLEEFSREVSVIHVDIPVLVPALRSVARYVIAKYVDPAGV